MSFVWGYIDVFFKLFLCYRGTPGCVKNMEILLKVKYILWENASVCWESDIVQKMFDVK